MHDAIGHRPVLTGEVVKNLVTRRDGLYIDGTVGCGGHTEAILEHLGKGGRILGIDRDKEALGIAQRRLGGGEGGGQDERLLLLHGFFEDLERACDLLGTRQVDGLLLDLGISSLQIDRPERGFSFSKEARLDMRMDLRDEITAEKIVSQGASRELERILTEFGEEPFAGRIARTIVEERRKRPISTTTELASLVARAIPRSRWPRRIHPATRTFQALRIAVNRELERLGIFLERVPAFLVPGGRLAVISYHSLEDRLVKRMFVRWMREKVMVRVTKKPIRPTEEETAANPRARSARLRVVEKTRGQASNLASPVASAGFGAIGGPARI